MRPSQSPASGARTKTLKDGARVQVLPPDARFPAPAGRRAQKLVELELNQQKAARTANVFGAWAEHREKTTAWLDAHPEAEQLAGALDTLGVRLAQARHQAETTEQAAQEAHREQAARLQAQVRQAQERVQGAGFFQRRGARADLVQAQEALAAHQGTAPASVVQETGQITELAGEQARVRARYEDLAQDFAAQVPTPQRPVGAVAMELRGQLTTEPLGVWRHLSRQPVTATEDTVTRAGQYQQRVERLQARRDWFAQDTPRVNAALWGQLKTPTRTPGPAGESHLVPQRERDSGLER